MAPDDPSTRPLSEVARHVVAPEGIVDTLWFEVEEQCREWGDEFDTWQDGLGQLTLGLRDDGLFAATVGGVTFSIPRQVAKTFIVGRIVFALAARYPNMTILWTAHRLRTASQTFDKLKALAKRPSVKPYMMANQSGGIRSVNGEQEFHFANGSKIMFGAREQGFGRGFDEVDIEVFDECQILAEKALEDMVAATNQSRFPHGALLIYMGTPPRPTDPGQVFTDRRAEALASKGEGLVYAESGDALYVECSADSNVGQPGGPAIDDLEQVAKANPSYPHRTPLVSIKRLFKNLTSDDSKRREGLGVWDEVATTKHVFDLGAWRDRRTDEAPPEPSVIALAVSIDQAFASISAAGLLSNTPYLGAVQHLRGTSMAVSETARICTERNVPVVVDGRGPAAFLIPKLEEMGCTVLTAGTNDYVEACAQLFELVHTEGGMFHGGTNALDEAVMLATTRTVGDRFAWARKSGDVSMLEAATLALWGLGQANNYDPLDSIL